jgi:hypothetical protein
LDIWLQAVTPHDIDAGIEQSGDQVLDGDVLIDPNPGPRIDLDHDINIAIRDLIAATISPSSPLSEVSVVI